MSAIIIADQARRTQISIPHWVDSLDSFRLWARSGAMPELGSFSFLGNDVWVDLSMEQFFSHNQVKAAFTFVLISLLQQLPLGRFVPDRMLLTNTKAQLSTEPDGLFFSWETMRSGRLRLIEGAEGGFVELEGTPDMVLEVISPTSLRKDTEVLFNLYHRAGIPEYWLVDARSEPLRFDIYRHEAAGYEARLVKDGWVHSAVFGRNLRLVQLVDPLGHPQYLVETRRP